MSYFILEISQTDRTKQITWKKIKLNEVILWDCAYNTIMYFRNDYLKHWISISALVMKLSEVDKFYFQQLF